MRRRLGPENWPNPGSRSGPQARNQRGASELECGRACGHDHDPGGASEAPARPESQRLADLDARCCDADGRACRAPADRSGLSWGRPLESGSAVSWTTGRAARPKPPSTTSKSRLRKPWTLGAGGGPDQVSRHDVYFRPPREAMSENGPTVSRRGARHKGWVREEDEWTAVPGVASAQRPSRSVLEDREAGARSVEVRRRACSPSWNGGESVKRLVT